MTVPTQPGFWATVEADLWRIEGRASTSSLLRQLTRGVSFKLVFWMRACAAARSGPAWRRVLYPLCRLLYRRYTFKYGISIPYTAEIGPGLYIGHFGGIVVSDEARIGRNCNLSQGVTIGATNRGSHRGAPVIGDEVYIGPGAKIIGAVRVGDRVAIGANAVVVEDLPDDAVAVGIPARVVSLEGSAGYVNRTDHPLAEAGTPERGAGDSATTGERAEPLP